MTPEQCAEINAAARFLPYAAPADPDDTAALPCIELAGVQVYVYADPARGLRLSVHFDDAAPPLSTDGGAGPLVPLELDLTGGAPALRIDAAGRLTYPAQEVPR